jgi:hypothetical protein
MGMVLTRRKESSIVCEAPRKTIIYRGKENARNKCVLRHIHIASKGYRGMCISLIWRQVF